MTKYRKFLCREMSPGLSNQKQLHYDNLDAVHNKKMQSINSSITFHASGSCFDFR
jgi:hypothetical protein